MLVNETEVCGYCGILMERMTAKDLTKGMCFLHPDEQWACPTCVLKQMRRVVIGSAS